MEELQTGIDDGEESRKEKYRVVFLGTPEFCLPSLEILFSHPQVELIRIISQPARAKGRGHQIQHPPVIEWAISKSIPFTQPENINKDSVLLEELQEGLGVDVFIVLAFAQFLSEKVLQLPKLGCFNIHTSLLPKYRGAAPIQYALLNGDSLTGVSIQRMVKKMDAGDVAHLETLGISPLETGTLLTTRLKFLAALALTNFLTKFFTNSLSFTPQDEKLVSLAPSIKKEDGEIHFQKIKVENLVNKLRAFDPWPGVYCFLNQKRLKIHHIEHSPLSLKAGETKIHEGKLGLELHVGCSNGSVRIDSLQLEGKKACSDTEFLRGFRGPLKLES